MNPLSLEHAQMMGTLIINRLAGRVSRIGIAGSIRRQKPTVNGLDFVLIPKPDPQNEGHTIPFFKRGTMVAIRNGEGSPERIIQFGGFTCRPVPVESYQTLFFNLTPAEAKGYTYFETDASRTTIYTLETVFTKEDLVPQGIRITVAIATEQNWGSVYLHRSGSKEYNEYLRDRAKKKNLGWVPEIGLFTKGDGPTFDFRQVVASKTEQNMFDALKLKFVPPEKRERKK